jgi:hypothetical protein
MSDFIAILVSKTAGPFTFLTVDKAMNCHYEIPNDRYGARCGNLTPFSVKRALKISGEEELTLGDLTFTGNRLNLNSVDFTQFKFILSTRQDRGVIDWVVDDLQEIWLVNLDKINLQGETRIEQELCDIDQFTFSTDEGDGFAEGCKAVESMIDHMQTQLEKFKHKYRQSGFLTDAKSSFSFSHDADGVLNLRMYGAVARATNQEISRKLLMSMKTGIEKFLMKRHLTAKQKELEAELAKVTEQLKG